MKRVGHGERTDTTSLRWVTEDVVADCSVLHSASLGVVRALVLVGVAEQGKQQQFATAKIDVTTTTQTTTTPQLGLYIADSNSERRELEHVHWQEPIMSLAIHNCSGHVRRWHAHVSNAEAARQQVVRVDGCPQRDADTQYFTRLGAAPVAAAKPHTPKLM